MSYPVHTIDTAPAAAKEVLAGAQKAFGFVPHLLGVMAEAPALVKAYTTLARLFEETSLTPTERQLVLLAVSYENQCHYCMAAHSVMASMQKVPNEVVDAIRNGLPIPDSKLEALRRFTEVVVASRGWPGTADTDAFRAAGYGNQQVLEVILGVGFKTLSNYTTHAAEPPLDAAFARAAWSSKAA